ncbi:MAG: hypothetical protein DRQ43_01810 [Gammaproteobacteria bacterium]|nr:MAG: hypothetical protein DRQ43_01810 [Gammaproteobacteria bacterium]
MWRDWDTNKWGGKGMPWGGGDGMIPCSKNKKYNKNYDNRAYGRPYGGGYGILIKAAVTALIHIMLVRVMLRHNR